MKKEEVLQASREENKKKDLALIEAENKGVKIAAIAILILSTVYFVLGITIQGKTNYGWYSILALYCTIVYGYRGFKSQGKTRKIDIITSIVWLLVSILTT